MASTSRWGTTSSSTINRISQSVLRNLRTISFRTLATLNRPASYRTGGSDGLASRMSWRRRIVLNPTSPRVGTATKILLGLLTHPLQRGPDCKDQIFHSSVFWVGWEVLGERRDRVRAK